MRIFIRYGREESVKYISHLDLMRTFQRAVRRAKVPIAFSEGFNPHPRMAFASALAVGVTSADEYMDILLAEDMAPGDIMQRLKASLPPGLPILGAAAVDERVPSLMSMVGRASYHVALLSPISGLEEAMTAIMTSLEILVEKKGKKGVQQVDIRPGIYEMTRSDQGENSLDLLLQSGSVGNIKPEQVLHQLFDKMGIENSENVPVRIHRTGLYIEKDGCWVSPLSMALQ